MCFRHSNFRLARVTIHCRRGVLGRARVEDTLNILTTKEITLAHPALVVGCPTIIGLLGRPSRSCRRSVLALAKRLFWVPYLLAVNT